MEEYKQYLLSCFSCFTSEKHDTLLETIKSGYGLHYMEEDLTSKYVDGRYRPAVVIKYLSNTVYYWLFNGEIRDWDHPFKVLVREGRGITKVLYYSTDRIVNSEPIMLRKGFSSEEVTRFYNISEDYETLLEGIDEREDKVNDSIYELAGIEIGETSPLCIKKLEFVD